MPAFYTEGTQPLHGDSEHRVNQKILAAIRATVGGGGVSDEDLINLANISGIGFLTRVGSNDWRTRTLIGSAALDIDNGNGVDIGDGENGNPTFRLGSVIGGFEGNEGVGFVVRELENIVITRNITSGDGISITNGDGIAANPSVALDINGLTEETVADDLDYIAIYDISDGDHNKTRRRDFLAGLTATATAKGARISATSTPAIPANTDVAREFQTEDFDTDTIATLGSAPTRLTCKTAGRYVICGDIQWASDNEGELREIWIRKNGTTRLATQKVFASQFLGPEMNICTVAQLAVNDFIELMVRTNTTHIGGGGLSAGDHFEMLAYA